MAGMPSERGCACKRPGVPNLDSVVLTATAHKVAMGAQSCHRIRMPCQFTQKSAIVGPHFDLALLASAEQAHLAQGVCGALNCGLSGGGGVGELEDRALRQTDTPFSQKP